MTFRLSIIIAALLLMTGLTTAWGEYQPWSEKVFEHVRQEYGTDAEKRLRYLHTMVVENQDLPDMEKVELVNKTLNHLPWIADSSHWKQADYWAAPMETITTFGGDCEDIAIVKWVVLVHLGITKEHLRLAYVKIKATGENHMVLLYIANPSAPTAQQEAYVLDNYVPEIKRGNERKDLLGIYFTDADGNVVLLDDKDGKRSIKGEYKERKIRKLEDLKGKIAQDRKKFQEINDGRPLLP